MTESERNVAGDNLCRLSDDEIAAMRSGQVQIPLQAEFLESCRRFHAQVSGEAGELVGCMTIAQLETEVARLHRENNELLVYARGLWGSNDAESVRQILERMHELIQAHIKSIVSLRERNYALAGGGES